MAACLGIHSTNLHTTSKWLLTTEAHSKRVRVLPSGIVFATLTRASTAKVSAIFDVCTARAEQQPTEVARSAR
jgi:hypothetical protein